MSVPGDRGRWGLVNPQEAAHVVSAADLDRASIALLNFWSKFAKRRSYKQAWFPSPSCVVRIGRLSPS